MRKIIILFLVLCSVCWPVTIKVGVITDIHIDTTDPNPGQPFGDTPGYRLPAYGDVSLPLAVTRFNDESVDIAVQMGDAINGGTIGAARNANFEQFVDRIDGTVGDALTPSLYYCLGHWDLDQSSADAADYAAFFHNDGMGTILPPAGAAAGERDTEWWPTIAANNSICSYSVSKNGFRLIFLSGILGSVGLNSAGASDDDALDTAHTQLEWLEHRLDAAQAASEPVIIFTHQPLNTTDSVFARIAGYADGLTLIEGAGYTIPIIVVGGHLHRDQSIITSTGIVHINLGGDVWGNSSTDTTRYSYAILEVTTPTYNTPDGNMGLIDLTGYGYQRSWSMNKALVGHWKLNEANGTAAAGDAIVDSSGNAYHGENSETVVSVSAPVGRGVSLDGTGDYINGGDVLIADYPFSMSIWVRQASNQTAVIFSLADADSGGVASDRFVELALQSGLPRMHTKPGVIAETDPTGTFTLPLDVWHLVVGVWTSVTDRKLYVNGVLDKSDTTSRAYPANIDGWTIGGRSAISTQSQLVTADLSDARIYSGALSANDVAKLYREGTSGLRRRNSTKKNTGLSRRRGR